MYAFLDPMWTRCLLIFVLSFGLFVAAKEDYPDLLEAVVTLCLLCVCIASYVGFILFLLKGI